ncbi:Ethyl tert-butyl ether degradation EthD [Sphingobium chlorophenolicum L-1]|uniref:Ethyl tert-butyl ether degradation EthD n=1 Tax=Sphingobium chlorophenolicum L-1 TaxID=690566 RepID=F6F359_SPHCR|nr:EthD domain-containing protein [Sphingobium chlorophenolicum]AEG50871.1 Ethyl tert-butyl ether degradation EthD [Sphingobium chlorophenolicum L-1]
MLKIVVLMKKKAGMSRADFIDHYENVHSVLGRKYLGHLFLNYVRNYPQGPMLPGGAGESSTPYDCITEIWLRDEAALNEMRAIIARPDVSAVLKADEQLFQDKAESHFLIVEEHRDG